MRALLEEALPRQLALEIAGHDVRTVADLDWTGQENGELLRLATMEGLEAFVTAGQNLEDQLKLAKQDIAVIVGASRTNRLSDLLPVVSVVLRVLPFVGKGEVVRVGD